MIEVYDVLDVNYSRFMKPTLSVIMYKYMLIKNVRCLE